MNKIDVEFSRHCQSGVEVGRQRDTRGPHSHALHRALSEVRCTYLNRIPLDILAKHPLDVLRRVYSENDLAHAWAAGKPK
jgi:hypothetical protein